MPTYKTPGVYIKEISLFPPSVAEVETAIPAFIGYTEKAMKVATNDLILKPTKIYSLKDYERYYGYPAADEIALTVDSDGAGGFTVASFSEPQANFKYLMYFSLKMFFDNGGGQCYIISVGTYQDTPYIGLNGKSESSSDSSDPATMYGLEDGLEVLALEDEPTLIVIPEAVKLTSSDYQSLVRDVLKQCNKLGDRFAIFDLFEGDKALEPDQLSTNRGYFGNNYLKYGATYYPFLKTTLNFYIQADETNVTVTVLPPGSGATATATVDGGVVSAIAVVDGGSGYTLPPTVTITGGDGSGATATATLADGSVNAITVDNGGTGYTSQPEVSISPATPVDTSLASFQTSNTALYNFVKSELRKHYVSLPPSAAVAGAYAATDNNRGVWKAPANVSLANVIEPVIKLDNRQQDDLNVDATTGKSINAIRAFMGKGTLIWGARTLAGNDNEWRYISVRRFFNTVEESVKKSTYWAVFEPNDANTWVKVRGAIESYLTQKWRDGALAGATPQEAFFVRCGLGTTMDSQDILEGRMNVEIGMAVVRPAEFVILKFSHKLQTS
ncbi:MAG: phage tail sheath family protein [Spirulina sp.]